MAVGGVQPVQMHPYDMDEKTIANARPDLVILAGNDFEALAAPGKAGVKDLQREGKVISVASIVGATAPLKMLGNMVGISLESYRKGEA